jgi:hypothetical protein
VKIRYVTLIAAALLAAPAAFSQDVRNTYVGLATQVADGILTNAKLANMADSTIKGRAVGAGSGVSTDLTAAQAAAIVGSVGGALKSKIIASTRDLAAVSGSVGYTGMGFQPTSCDSQGDAGDSATQYVTILGRSDSALGQSSLAFGGSAFLFQNFFMYYVNAAASGNQSFTITSYDADGFTGTWTKTGSPSGTVNFQVRCFR